MLSKIAFLFPYYSKITRAGAGLAGAGLASLMSYIYTAKGILEGLGIQTSSSLVKI